MIWGSWQLVHIYGLYDGLPYDMVNDHWSCVTHNQSGLASQRLTGALCRQQPRTKWYGNQHSKKCTITHPTTRAASSHTPRGLTYMPQQAIKSQRLTSHLPTCSAHVRQHAKFS